MEIEFCKLNFQPSLDLHTRELQAQPFITASNKSPLPLWWWLTAQILFLCPFCIDPFSLHSWSMGHGDGYLGCCALMGHDSWWVFGFCVMMDHNGQWVWVLRFDGSQMQGRGWACWDFVWLGLVIGFGGCFNRSVWFNEFPLMGWWIWMVFGSNGVCCVWSLIVQLAWVWLFFGMKFMVLIFWVWICWVCSSCSWCQIFHLLGWNSSFLKLEFRVVFYLFLIPRKTYTSWPWVS